MARKFGSADGTNFCFSPPGSDDPDSIKGPLRQCFLSCCQAELPQYAMVRKDQEPNPKFVASYFGIRLLRA